MKPLDRIAGYNIPTDSYVAAVQFLNDRGELTPEEYRFRIVELSGHETKATNEFIRFHYLYLIQETIRTALLTDPDELDMKEMFDLATDKAEHYIKNNPWVFVKPEAEPKLDASGNVKPKKGAKKEMAKAVYAEHKNDGLTRKEFIALLVKEVGLTPAGASTYYANLKAGRL